MFSRKPFVLFFTVLFMLFIMMSAAAHADSSVYSWQDTDGVISFTDDPSLAPSSATVKVFPASARSTDPTETPVVGTPSQDSRGPTEGEFAVQLVEELGLSDDPTPEEAADILTNIRIVPRLGQWELNQPMTEELTTRLRKLAVAAADAGRLTLSADEVLLAFDTTAALLGLNIPVPSTPDGASEEASERAPAPYPLAETPPLVYVTTPPPEVIYPYYVWYPVTGGFWWNGVFCSGFFALNTNFFFSNHHDRFFRGHHGNWNADHIGRQFQNRIANRHFGRNPGFSNHGRVTRSPADAGRSSVSNRFPARSQNGMRFSGSGSRLSRTPDSRHFSQRSVSGSRSRSMPGSNSRPVTRGITRSMSRPISGSVGSRSTPIYAPVRRQSFSSRSGGRMSMAGPSRQSFSGGNFSRPVQSRSFSGPSRSFSAPSGQSFSRGSMGGGMGGGGMGMNRASFGGGSFRGR